MAAADLTGKKIKKFSLACTGGEEFALDAHKGKRLVLYFYPKDSTPGCTTEGHEFSERIAKFRKLGAEVFGVSRDSIKSHENFKSKQGYKFELLSDPDEKACKLFDVIQEKNMYGRKVLGIERSTFVVDAATGKVLKEWRKVKAQGHAQEVLEYLASL